MKIIYLNIEIILRIIMYILFQMQSKDTMSGKSSSSGSYSIDGSNPKITENVKPIKVNKTNSKVDNDKKHLQEQKCNKKLNDDIEQRVPKMKVCS